MMNKIVPYVVIVLLLGGGLAGYIKVREHEAAKRAILARQIDSLTTETSKADSIIAERNRRDSIRAVQDSARADTLRQQRRTMDFLRSRVTETHAEVDSLRELVDLASLPQPVQDLINATTALADTAEKEAETCRTALTLSDSLRLSCATAVHERDSTIAVILGQRDRALELAGSTQQTPSFFQSLPKELFKGGLWTGLGILLGFFIFGGN